MITRALIVTLVAAAACGGKAAPPAKPPANIAATPAPPAPVADTFAAEATKAGFVYTPQAGFTPTAIVDNMDVSYDHAVRSADGRIELRYALRPYPPDLPPPMRTGQFSSTFFLTAILNITRGGSLGDATEAKALVADEFAADEATVTFVRWHDAAAPDDAFARGYLFAAVVYLHRDGLGDGYLFAMVKDAEAGDGVTDQVLGSLRFAPR